MRDPRIDEYIAAAQPFARPVLRKMRTLVHRACPGVTETIKWGMPSFEYRGPLFGMAAFKAHCAGGFWKATLLKDPKGYLGRRKNQGGAAMGHLGCLASAKDLPPEKAFLDFVRQHMALNEQGVRVPKKKTAPKPLVIPPALMSALRKNKKALAVFNAFPPSHRREYADWVAEAKTGPTREKRIRTALEWIAEGKQRHWKYARK